MSNDRELWVLLAVVLVMVAGMGLAMAWLGGAF